MNPRRKKLLGSVESMTPGLWTRMDGIDHRGDLGVSGKIEVSDKDR